MGNWHLLYMGQMLYETEEGEHGYQRLKGGALLIVDPDDLPDDVRAQKLAELANFKCDLDRGGASMSATPTSTVSGAEEEDVAAAYEGFVWGNTTTEVPPPTSEQQSKTPGSDFGMSISATPFVPNFAAAAFVPK